MQEQIKTTLRDALSVIFKRKKSIFLIFILTVVLVTGITLLLKPSYLASGSILVKLGRQNVYSSPLSLNTQVISYEKEGILNSEVELIRSRLVAEKVIEVLGPENMFDDLSTSRLSKAFKSLQRIKVKTPVEQAILLYQEFLSVSSVGKSNVIEISFEHSDPEMAAQIVNTIITVYLEERISMNKRSSSLEFFQEQVKLLANRLGKAEQEWKDFRKKHRVTELSEQQRLLLQRLSDLEYEIHNTRSKRLETEKLIREKKIQLVQIPQSISKGTESALNNTVINNLESQLIELQLKEKQLLNKYTEKNRLVVNIKEDIALVELKLAEYNNKKYKKEVTVFNPIYQDLNNKLYELQADMSAIKVKQNLQQQQLKNYRDQLEDLNKIEVQLNRLQQKVEVNRENYRLYQAKLEEARIKNSMDDSKMNDIVLMKAAKAPLEPIHPKVKLNIVIGILMGIFGGIGSAFIRDYFDTSLESPEDIVESMGVQVFGCISNNFNPTWGEISENLVESDMKLSLRNNV